MKKAIELMLITVLVFITGCSSEKQLTKPAVTTNQAAQTQENIKNLEKSANSIETKTTPELLKDSKNVYKQSQAHSKQKVIATFKVGSNICTLRDKELQMEGDCIYSYNLYNSKEVYIPLKAFITAAGIPEGDAEVRNLPKPVYRVTLKKDYVTAVFEDDNYPSPVGTLRMNGKEFQYHGPAGKVDKSGITYIALTPFAKVFQMDVFRDDQSGNVELLEGMPLTEKDFSFGPIIWGMTVTQVKDLSGKLINIVGPRPTEGSKDEDELVLTYPGIKLTAIGKRGSDQSSWPIWYISCTTSDYKTQRGIGGGDRIENVIALYGMGYVFCKETSSYNYSPISIKGQLDRVISFRVKDGIVTEISVYAF